MLRGGNTNNNTNAGAFYFNVNNNLTNTNTNIGLRASLMIYNIFQSLAIAKNESLKLA